MLRYKSQSLLNIWRYIQMRSWMKLLLLCNYAIRHFIFDIMSTNISIINILFISNHSFVWFLWIHILIAWWYIILFLIYRMSKKRSFLFSLKIHFLLRYTALLWICCTKLLDRFMIKFIRHNSEMQKLRKNRFSKLLHFCLILDQNYIFVISNVIIWNQHKKLDHKHCCFKKIMIGWFLAFLWRKSIF